jgi:glucose uptake protein GlcU
MSNQPLNSSDQIKIFIFFLLLAPTVFFLVGVIPALLLGYGIIMMKKNEDFSHIENAIKICRLYIGVLLSGCIILTAASPAMFDIQIEKLQILFLMCAGICIAYLIFVNALFLKPLAKHSEWVQINGIFSSKPKASLEMNIMKRGKLQQYSVADELLKWSKLKEDGHISEKDFNELKEKLLK